MSPRLVTVILNYRSARDTVNCIKSLSLQKIENNTIIVVDNSESICHSEELVALLDAQSEYLYSKYIESELDSVNAKQSSLYLKKQLVLVNEVKNKGFSAGNNVGIRYALAESADAVLIVNPDVEFNNPNSISDLMETLFLEPSNCIVAPRVKDINNKDQNPLKEPIFWEEFFQPVQSLFEKVGKIDSETQANNGHLTLHNTEQVVDKVIGCCFLINTSFLKKTGLLDENTFLYCEEAILAEKVRASGGRVVYQPLVLVRHLHKFSKVSSKNYQCFVKSRMYYLREYKGYGLLKCLFIWLSHSSIYLYIRFVEIMRKYLLVMFPCFCRWWA